MKKVIMMTIVAVSLSLSAMAQEDGQQQKRQKIDRTEMIQKRTDMMVQRYGLNEEQKNQLFQLNTNYADAIPMMGGPRRHMGRGHNADANKGQNKPQNPPTEMKKDDQNKDKAGRGRGPRGFNPEAMQKYDNALKGIFTEEQYAKYESDKKARMERRPQRRVEENKNK